MTKGSAHLAVSMTGADRWGGAAARWSAPAPFALFIVLLGPITLAAIAQESCLKLMLGPFCLGGDVNLLLGQAPQSIVHQGDGDRLA